MSDLQKQLDTMTATNMQMQAALEALQTEKQILNQTLGEVMTANIQFRTAMVLLENQSKKIAASLAAKEKECVDLQARLAPPPVESENPAPQESCVPSVIPDNGQ